MTQIFAPQRKAFDSSGVQFAWDSTSLGTYSACPRKYQYTILFGWQGKSLSPHLHFGILYHHALELLDHIKVQRTPTEADLVSILRDTFEKAGSRDEDGVFSPWQSDHKDKNLISLARAVVWYFYHFLEDPFENIELSDGTAAVELSFRLPLTSDIQYCGHLDKLGTLGGNVFFLDRKTSGSALSSRYYSQFSPSIQMTGYYYAGKVIYSQPIKGGIIDAAQIGVNFVRFGRDFITRTDEQLEEWAFNSARKIKQAQGETLDLIERGHDLPMNEQACTMYGGCPFQSICSRSPKIRDSLLRSDFVQSRPWDPLADKGVGTGQPKE